MKFVASHAQVSFDGGQTWSPFPIVPGGIVEITTAGNAGQSVDRAATFTTTLPEFDPAAFGIPPESNERRFCVIRIGSERVDPFKPLPRKRAQWKNEPKRKGPKPR